MHAWIKAMLIAMLALALVAATAEAAGFEVTAAVQAELDRQKAAIAQWAADPAIVGAVRDQNARGPIPGMDNAKWKVTRRSDPVVREFQANAAGRILGKKLAAAAGAFNEAFLSAGQGEKVAFVEKTTSYIHVGQAKFDVPFTTGRAWQGKPEFDESSQTYAIQIAVPVLADGKPIGALVVGVNLTYLEKIAKK